MRYRDINTLETFSRDVSIVIDLVGEKEYRESFALIRHSLNLKKFVTPYDDALFALELDLLNLEKLRAECSGDFKFFPSQCHAGVNFLIGLGQTIPALSPKARSSLLGRVKGGLREGLWPLQHELGVAGNLSKRGWDIYFHDLEDGGGYDFLASKDGMNFEVETKAISAFAGWPIKPENLNKLLVEIKGHFEYDADGTIPLIALTLPGSLPAERTQLQRLVSAFSEVAKTRKPHSAPEFQVRFMGTVPDMTPGKLRAAAIAHGQMARKTVLINPVPPKVVLEIDSERPVEFEKKIIRLIRKGRQ